MKISRLSKGILIIAAMWSCITAAETFNYAELKMRDYDEMMSAVKKHILAAEKISNEDIDSARAQLEEALQLILSRPNSDNMVSQLVPVVRTPLKNIDSYEVALAAIVDRTLTTLKVKQLKPRDGATSLIVLDNFMSEMKPDAKNNKAIKSIFVKIRDAKIVTNEEVKNEMHLRAMLKTATTPSATAEKIIGAK